MITPKRQRELVDILDGMQRASNRFYSDAMAIQHHQFIEFAGLMNEYITICQRALAAGIDFQCESDLPMEGYHVRYLREKLGCIYGDHARGAFGGDA